MQQVLAYFLIVLFSGSLFMHSTIKIHFEWNRTEIAALLCINKDKPELSCKGQCVLMKRLNESESSKDAPLTLPDNRTQNHWLVTRTLNVPTGISEICTTAFSNVSTHILNRYFSIDVPPPKI